MVIAIGAAVVCIRKRVALKKTGKMTERIKYPFRQMTYENEKAVYASINFGEAYCPKEISDKSICIDGDIGDVLKEILINNENQ